MSRSAHRPAGAKAYGEAELCRALVCLGAAVPAQRDPESAGLDEQSDDGGDEQSNDRGPPDADSGDDGDRAERAAAWVAERRERLWTELCGLEGVEPCACRARLRALQRELHPDKHPPWLRDHVQPLFVMVQREWEAHDAAQRCRDREQAEGDSQEGAAAAEAETPREEATARQRREEEERRWHREEQNYREAQEAGGSDFAAQRLELQRLADAARRNRSWEQVGPGEEMDRADLVFPGGLLKVSRLLGGLWQVSHGAVLEALEIVDQLRSAQGWREALQSPQLDLLEAEALRQQAHRHASSGRYGDAIYGCLQRAIALDGSRAELHTLRALCRLRQHFAPGFRFPTELLPSQAHAVREVLEDVERASVLGPALADAYELAVPLLLARGDLEAAERLAQRGAEAVQDSRRAEALGREHAYARDLRQGLERAEALVVAEENRPVDDRRTHEVEPVVRAVRDSAGPRLEAPYRKSEDQDVSHPRF